MTVHSCNDSWSNIKWLYLVKMWTSCSRICSICGQIDHVIITWFMLKPCWVGVTLFWLHKRKSSKGFFVSSRNLLRNELVTNIMVTVTKITDTKNWRHQYHATLVLISTKKISKRVRHVRGKALVDVRGRNESGRSLRIVDGTGWKWTESRRAKMPISGRAKLPINGRSKTYKVDGLWEKWTIPDENWRYRI